MRIGTMIDTGAGLHTALETARDAAARGLASVWMAQLFGVDALTALAVIGREVPDIELGTAVVPTYPRHPAVLAGQALTTQAASGGRLALGIGLSHQLVIEGMYGYSFDRPARHMREYLSILGPLLHGESPTVEGETLTFRSAMPMKVAGATPPPVLLAALAPRMLQLAGELAEGTITWMVGPRTAEEHIVPSITRAAAEAGRPAPRIVVSLPVLVTDDPAAAREQAAKRFALYGGLPSYRAMLDREGADGPADVAIVGDEEAVAKEIRGLEGIGATDFNAIVFGGGDDATATLDLLTDLARSS